MADGSSCLPPVGSSISLLVVQCYRENICSYSQVNGRARVPGSFLPIPPSLTPVTALNLLPGKALSASSAEGWSVLLRGNQQTRKSLNLQIFLSVKYFKEKVGFCNELKPRGEWMFQSRGKLGVKSLQTEKAWIWLFHTFSRCLGAWASAPLQLSPDICLTGQNKLTASLGLRKINKQITPCFVLYLPFPWNLLTALLSGSN